jgi:hypothetical protein
LAGSADTNGTVDIWKDQGVVPSERRQAMKDRPLFGTINDKSAKTSRNIVAVVFGLMAIGSLILCFSIMNTEPSDSSQDKVELTAGQLAIINDLQSQGMLRIESSLNTVYVDPSLWAAMDAKQKEDVSGALAIYCANQKGTTTYWVDILDKQSGRKLAKWSQAFGFKVY